MQPDDALFVVEVVDVQPDGLGDPRARRVEQLQQGPVAQRDGTVPDAAREELLHLVGGEGAGQPQRLRGWRDVAGHVLGDDPVARGEAVQPAHGRERAGGRRRRQLPVPQGGHERGDVGGAHLGQVAVAEVLEVAVQVTGVGAQRVGRAPPLDGQVVQEGLDRIRHPHGAHHAHPAAPLRADAR